MIPYADFTYFGLLLYPALPTLALGLGTGGRFFRRWVPIVVVLALVAQYWGSLEVRPGVLVPDLAILAGYGLLQLAVALLFARVRPAVGGRWPFYGALGLALAPLVLAKLLPVLWPSTLLGFLGISYVTFRALDVIFSLNDKLITGVPVVPYLVYLFFFPTISSGPIDRFRRFLGDWGRGRTRAEFIQDLDGALHRLFTGFLYKFILAALIKQYWLDPVAQETGALALVSYMYAYSLYLFFDFAGYSCFAIGVSYLFGIRVPENFNRPFLARDMRDFWNRWHISLSTWFRDHVYMRFVLAATKGRWFKGRYTASTLGFFVSFGLMGLWHGLEWYYLLYGLYHAALLAGVEWFGRWNRQRRLWGEGRLWNLAGIVLTFHAVCLGFLLFSGRLNPPAPATAARPASQPAVVEEEDVPEEEIVPGPADDGYAGSHDVATCRQIAGWAWDATQPDTPIDVDIYDGDTKLVTITANQMRDDLRRAGKGNGRHGFSYTIPSSLRDNREHVIRVKIGDTDIELVNTPKTITCK